MLENTYQSNTEILSLDEISTVISSDTYFSKIESADSKIKEESNSNNLNEVFGINLNLLDITLKMTYESFQGDSAHQKTKQSRGNLKFFTIDIFISDNIIDSVKLDKELSHIKDIDNKYLQEIEKFFIYKKNKVILKIAEHDITEINNVLKETKSKKIKKTQNCLAFISEEINYELLSDFFKLYSELITYRNVLDGEVRSDYYPICKLIFFNSKLYGHNYTSSNIDKIEFYAKSIPEMFKKNTPTNSGLNF